MNVKFTRTRSTYLVTVKYDEQGKEFIKGLREHYKDWCKTLELRGRGYRQGVNRYRQSLPLSKATHVAIYLR